MSTSEMGPMLLTLISTSTTAGGPPKFGLTLLSYPLNKLSSRLLMFLCSLLWVLMCLLECSWFWFLMPLEREKKRPRIFNHVCERILLIQARYLLCDRCIGRDQANKSQNENFLISHRMGVYDLFFPFFFLLVLILFRVISIITTMRRDVFFSAKWEIFNLWKEVYDTLEIKTAVKKF